MRYRVVSIAKLLVVVYPGLLQMPAAQILAARAVLAGQIDQVVQRSGIVYRLTLPRSAPTVQADADTDLPVVRFGDTDARHLALDLLGQRGSFRGTSQAGDAELIASVAAERIP